MKNKKHSVLEHLLTRKNKKVPVNDGRTISLVHFGGMMTGVYGGGAMIALEELGLNFAFDNIYTISAGFANASYLLSGQTKLGTSIYYEDVSGNKFIKFSRFWKIADIDYVMDVVKKVKTLNVKNILGCKTKLLVRLDNGTTKKTQYLEAHNLTDAGYFKLYKAAISVPFLFPGYTKINGHKFKDPDFSDNTLLEHVKHALSSKATDIVILYNQYRQYQYVNKSIKHLPKQRVCQIYPDPKWKLGIFETNSAILKQSAQKMGDRVKHIFGNHSGINLDYK